MPHAFARPRHPFGRRVLAIFAVLCAAVVFVATPAHAAQNGPDPTAGSAATTGTFAYSRTDVPDLQTPHTIGAASIFYPVDGSRTYGGVAGVAGFSTQRNTIEGFAALLASHGFVVITVDTNTAFDLPGERATALLGALDYLVYQSSVKSRVEASRRGVFGYSMGGGGAIEAAARRPSLKAAVPFVPWHLTKTWHTPVPVGIIAAQNDTTARPAEHGIPLYQDLTGGGEKSYLELARADHVLAGADFPTLKRHFVSWTKRFVDADTRYTQFLCPGPVVDNVKVSDYRSTCPF